MASRRLAESSGAARGPPRWFDVLCGLVRDRGLRIRRISRVLLNAANEIKRGVERLVILRIRRDVGLRAGLLVAFGLEVAAQRSLAVVSRSAPLPEPSGMMVCTEPLPNERVPMTVARR
jgi:hypothetical protein